MEKFKLNTQELVEMFGTDKQKEKYRSTGKLMTNVKNNLIKKAETEYEMVEVVKEGRSNLYVISGQREIRKPKEDGRIKNGSYSISYTKNLDLLIVSTLENKNTNQRSAQTMKKWLLDFGIISPELFYLWNSNNLEEDRQEELEKLVDKKIIGSLEEYGVVEDYLNFSRELQGQLESTLKRMEKCGIINFYPVYKAKVFTGMYDEEGKPETQLVNLHETTVEDIAEKKRQLKEKHNVTDYDLRHLQKKIQVKEFKKDYIQFLKDGVYDITQSRIVRIEYYWKAHAIQVIATQNKVDSYLLKYNREAIEAYQANKKLFIEEAYREFKKERMNRVVEMAQKQDEYIKQNKVSFEDYDGLISVFTPEAFMGLKDIRYNRDYYKMFLNNTYVEKIRALEEYYSYNF